MTRDAYTPLGLAPSFGFGDRIGSATRGHVEAMKRCGSGIEPIYPQQSIREMTRSERTPRAVLRDALAGMREAGWERASGADADHLKTRADVAATAAAGFTLFTIDPSDHVDAAADDLDPAALRARFRAAGERVDWSRAYVGVEVSLARGAVVALDEAACMRSALKYAAALDHATALAEELRSLRDAAARDYELELSLDETRRPTTVAEHYLVADQCSKRGVELVSLALRLPGSLEKGVDYAGDLVALEAWLADHAAIARHLGPYKLSLHSGSDKLSLYPALARATAGRFHVKTAGTSYLEALRVVGRHDGALFRRIVGFARSRYEADRASYEVSAALADVPPPDRVRAAPELERLYLGRWEEVPEGGGLREPGRQILHCTYGSVLTHRELGPALRGVLDAHRDAYSEGLVEHFGRHLRALRRGMDADSSPAAAGASH